jgi:predicted PhzF superfamily epimerase YddE/YHI9
MQRVAMEMNQAETAFLVPTDDGYNLRWFTPTTEVDLCGHATLASAHVLWETQRVDRGEPIRFQTRSGLLLASAIGDEIELDFPAEAPALADLPVPLPFLDTSLVWTGRNRMDWFVQVESAAQVRALVPDYLQIAALGMRGLIVTAPGDEGFDFVSRCFFPQSGVDEDPVTGSAHCALAPFWSERLGNTEMRGYQASRRGGTVAVTVAGDRVRLRGRAITTLVGDLQC